MFKCCVSGAREDVEEARRERAKRDEKPTNQLSGASTAATNRGKSGMTITSGPDDVDPSALASEPDRVQNVASGAPL